MSNSWVGWTGGECPLPHSSIVNLKFADGSEFSRTAVSIWEWQHKGIATDIVAFQLVGQDKPAREWTVRVGFFGRLVKCSPNHYAAIRVVEVKENTLYLNHLVQQSLRAMGNKEN